MKNTKKDILKKYTGKGGLKEGLQNIGEHTKKNFKDAYSSNMAQRRENSAINKNMFPDSIMAGVKGAIYGGIGATDAIKENIKSHINKVKSVISPEKAVLKKVIKKTGVGTRYPDMKPLQTSMPIPKKIIPNFKNLAKKMPLERSGLK